MWVTRVQLILLVTIVLSAWCSAQKTTTYTDPSKAKLRILGIFGHPGKSHFDVFRPLLEELARRGHNVTIVSHFPRPATAKAKEPLPNYKDISLSSDQLATFLNVVDLKKVDHSYRRIVMDMLMLRGMASLSCGHVLRSPQIREFVASGEKYDVVLTENFNTECFLAIINKFDAPYLALSSHQVMPWANSRMGNPQELSYMPVIFQGLPRPMNFPERVVNALSTFFVSTVYDYYFHWVDQALAEETYGPGVPDLRELARKAKAVFVNTHHSIHGIRPHLPNVVEIGGLHIPANTNPLPKDIARFLDDAHEGVLYFNLGSMVKAASMPSEVLDIILHVLGTIPRKVIWKWEADDLPYKPDNLLIGKWLPQFDIMNHPNVKAYMGHGGLLGLSEGVYTGMPMVLIPIFGDQFHNAAAAETRGTAVVLQYKELSEQTLRHALDEVFNNTRYRENAQKLSKAYRDRPASPLDTAVWWTEHIARGNGSPYLKSEGANLPWYQRQLVDVTLFLLAIAVLLLYSLYRVGKLLLSLTLSSPRKATAPMTNGVRKQSKKRD